MARLSSMIDYPQREVPGDGPIVAKRWPHAVKVLRTPVYVDFLGNAPDLWNISSRLSGEIHQGVSHILKTPEELGAAKAALKKAMANEGRL